MIARIEKVVNGDMIMDEFFYQCEICEKEMHESWPIVYHRDEQYCEFCAFLKGIIGEQECIDKFFNNVSWLFKEPGLEIVDGRLHMFCKERRKNKKNNKRNSYSYQHWRKQVYQRDRYTCQRCGQVGGVLNAHHKKSYKKFPKLRLEITNGVTLCAKCHRKVHLKKK